VREDFISNLSRVVQLTGECLMLVVRFSLVNALFAGFSDAVYAEAYVKVHQFDILLGTS
jgi:Coatomer beta C-terminal region